MTACAMHRGLGSFPQLVLFSVYRDQFYVDRAQPSSSCEVIDGFRAYMRQSFNFNSFSALPIVISCCSGPMSSSAAFLLHDWARVCF